MNEKILLTGASGFVGKEIYKQLEEKNIDVLPVYRSEQKIGVQVASIDGETDWSNVFAGNFTHVIHVAARVHIMQDTSVNPLFEFRKVNTIGTLKLARQASDNGVRRFIFISSIKVNGEFSQKNKPFTPEDECNPEEPYARSKYEAELGLMEIAKKTEMQVVIIRPPLVYGPNVEANFRTMMKWLYAGIPLPFGRVNNVRSLIAVQNLAGFVIHCLVHPLAANEIFTISDNEDVSTTELLKMLASAMDKKSRLLPIPVRLMEFFMALLNQRKLSDRLFGDLHLDSTKAGSLLEWENLISMQQAIKLTVKNYINEKNI